MGAETEHSTGARGSRVCSKATHDTYKLGEWLLEVRSGTTQERDLADYRHTRGARSGGKLGGKSAADAAARLPTATGFNLALGAGVDLREPTADAEFRVNSSLRTRQTDQDTYSTGVTGEPRAAAHALAAAPVHQYGSSLVQQCGQLSPAGTGSQTLRNTLHALRGSSVHSHTTIPDAPCYFMTLRDPARRLESGFRYEVLNPRGGRRLFDLSWNKTSPGDDGSFFLRAHVTYFNAAAAKGAHVYFLCTDTLTHDMELLFRNASMDATTGNVRHQLASPELLRRSTLSAEAAWYIRSLFAADWALVHRHCPRRF